MIPEQFQQVRRIFLEACELPEGKRRGFLARTCRDDIGMLKLIQEMLDEDSNPLPLSAEGAIRPELEVLLDSEQERGARDDDGIGDLPDQIGDLQIVRRIGEGGMSVVFEARQEHPQRVVALKLVRFGLATRDMLKRFEREIDILGKLHHPGIAQIYEAGRMTVGNADLPFFTMELIDGTDLIEYANGHRLADRERCELMARLCEAVEHAHAKGILHRDLKPANVLVEDSREGGQPKVLDFGIARAVATDVEATTLCTHTGEIIGTIRYMSPEQVAGDSTQIDARSDVYALGVILYELLADHPPYDLDGREIPEAIHIIRFEEPTPLLAHARHLKGDLETIVMKAMEKDRHRRYASALGLAEDLRRFLNDEPIVARPASTIYKLKKFTRRNRSLVLGAGATVLAIALGLIGTLTFASRSAQDAESASNSDRIARESRELVRDKQRVAEWLSYKSNLLAAAKAIEEQDLVIAERHLNEAPAPHRGFEWHYLQLQLRQWEGELKAPSPIVGEIGFDPAAKEILVGLAEGGIASFDAADGQLKGVRQTALSISTVSDGVSSRRAGLGTRDGAIAIWNREDDTIDVLVEPNGQPVHVVRFSSNGERLLCSRGQEALLVDLGSRSVILRVENTGPSTPLPLGLDGERFVCGEGDSLVIWNATDGSSQRLSVTGPALGIAQSPDQKHLAVGLESGAVVLLDAQSGTELRRLTGHRSGVHRLAFSPDGTRLATAGYEDGTICLWKLADGALLKVYSTLDRQPFTLRFWREGQSLLSRAVSRQGETSLLSWPVRPEPSTLIGRNAGAVHKLVASADGKYVASATYGRGPIRVWRTDDSPTLVHEIHPKQGATVSIATDGRHLWMPGALYDIEAGTHIPMSDSEYLALDRSSLKVTKANRFGPRGKRWARISIGDYNGQVGYLQLWSYSDPVGTLFEPNGAHGCAFSADGTRLAAAYQDGHVRVFDTAKREEIATFLAHSDKVYCVEYSPDGRRLATGSQDGTIRIWDAHYHELLLELPGQSSFVFDLVFLNDRIFSGAGNSEVRMWDARPLAGGPPRSGGGTSEN